MFFSKKKRIKAYLAAKPEHTPFDDILQNWIDEQFEEKLLIPDINLPNDFAKS